jgi:hypothetical protein
MKLIVTTIVTLAALMFAAPADARPIHKGHGNAVLVCGRPIAGQPATCFVVHVHHINDGHHGVRP